MAKERPPATFLSLARELRQSILTHSYPYENYTSSWTFAGEKAKVDELVAALRTAIRPTCSAILLDIQYAETKWRAKLQEIQRAVKVAGAAHCNDLEDQEALWTIICEGQAPWIRIHRKLYLMNRKWWYETAAGNEWVQKKEEMEKTNGKRDNEAFGSLVDKHVHPPWDNQARCRNVLHFVVTVDAWVGPSGLGMRRTSSAQRGC